MPFILLFMLLFSSSVHSSRLLHSERRCLVFHPPLHAPPHVWCFILLLSNPPRKCRCFCSSFGQ